MKTIKIEKETRIESKDQTIVLEKGDQIEIKEKSSFGDLQDIGRYKIDKAKKLKDQLVEDIEKFIDSVPYRQNPDLSKRAQAFARYLDKTSIKDY